MARAWNARSWSEARDDTTHSWSRWSARRHTFDGYLRCSIVGRSTRLKPVLKLLKHFEGRDRSAFVQVPRDRLRILKERFRLWAHRLTLVGYLLSAVGAWMLVKRPVRSGFVWLAVGATLQLMGGLLRH
jgi:hypothetical protein